ncbi:MAG: hypothetical protein KC620_16395 [Myxococcales bacterium]|nr:hypothetical protein [Myxococcales bacterium]
MDRYFDFFSKLASFVDIRLLRFEDLNHFFYYFELLSDIERDKGQGFGVALEGYLRSYRFGGCQKCLRWYSGLPPSQRMEPHLSIAGPKPVHSLPP